MMLLIGPPCSGKTTIGRILSQATNSILITLDDFLLESAETNSLKEGDNLTDAQIDNAVKDLLFHMKNGANSSNRIYEIPYHDYCHLLNQIDVRNHLLIIGLNVPYERMMERNCARKLAEQIPIKYLDRCHNTMQILKEKNDQAIHFFDTEVMSKEKIVIEIINIILARNYE